MHDDCIHNSDVHGLTSLKCFGPKQVDVAPQVVTATLCSLAKHKRVACQREPPRTFSSVVGVACHLPELPSQAAAAPACQRARRTRRCAARPRYLMSREADRNGPTVVSCAVVVPFFSVTCPTQPRSASRVSPTEV